MYVNGPLVPTQKMCVIVLGMLQIIYEITFYDNYSALKFQLLFFDVQHVINHNCPDYLFLEIEKTTQFLFTQVKYISAKYNYAELVLREESSN